MCICQVSWFASCKIFGWSYSSLSNSFLKRRKKRILLAAIGRTGGPGPSESQQTREEFSTRPHSYWHWAPISHLNGLELYGGATESQLVSRKMSLKSGHLYNMLNIVTEMYGDRAERIWIFMLDSTSWVYLFRVILYNSLFI